MCIKVEFYWFCRALFNYLNKTFPRLTGATDWHLSESLNNCSTKSSVESWKEHWFCRFLSWFYDESLNRFLSHFLSCAVSTLAGLYLIIEGPSKKEN